MIGELELTYRFKPQLKGNFNVNDILDIVNSETKRRYEYISCDSTGKHWIKIAAPEKDMMYILICLESISEFRRFYEVENDYEAFKDFYAYWPYKISKGVVSKSIMDRAKKRMEEMKDER